MRTFLILLAVIAALVSSALIVIDRQAVIDVFELADPTTGFGIYFHLLGLAANLAVIFVAVCVLLTRPRSGFRTGFAIAVFVPSALEVLAALPCFLTPRAGALCGVGAVLVVYASIPVVIVGAIGFVATSQRRPLRIAGMTLAAAFLVSAIATQLLLAPADPAQCAKLSEVTKRSNCLRVFANRHRDESLCRSIEFRSTRFTCLREIAVEKRQPELCEEIADTAPLAAYDSPAAFYRDACFQNLAYALHDRGQCAKVQDKQLRAGCEARNP